MVDTTQNRPNSEQMKKLGARLRYHREKLCPKDAGLTTDMRRRHVTGLRREEVAALAGISFDTYTKLEQGTYLHAVTYRMIDSICSALRCDRFEREHIFSLAGLQISVEQALPIERVSPVVQMLLDNLDDCLSPTPAYVMGQRWDFLAWNGAAIAAFGPFDKLPEGKRNVLWYMFVHTYLRQRMPSWEGHAQRIVAQFRPVYDLHAGDTWFDDLIALVQHQSQQFREWWSRSNIQGKPEGAKEVRNDDIGFLTFTQVTWYQKETNQMLVCYVPDPTTDTAEKLRQLPLLASAHALRN